MNNLLKDQQNIADKGFTVIDDVYNAEEIGTIISAINGIDQSNPAFRKTNDLFAIRRFLKEIPFIHSIIFNDNLKSIISELFDDKYFIVKSIYFNKPEKSNWFVALHQDLTISVAGKAETPGYGPWTVKLNNFGVQPPVELLQDNFTIRIHLDDTDAGNGALRVIPGSHLWGVYRAESINRDVETEEICGVKAGGVMLMRPLLMHASDRSTNNKTRKVIHIEFSKADLPEGINWAEKELVSLG